MAEYSSGSVSIAGLGNGTDFTEMIDALKTIELKQANKLAKWRDDWEERLAGFREVRTAMAEFSTWLKTMNSEEKFMIKSAQTANSAVCSVTNTVGAMDGVYTMEVNQLATNSYANTKTTCASNLDVITTVDTTFKFTVGTGTEKTINVPKNTTLGGLVNLINNEKSGELGATLMEAGGEYYLQLYSKTQGSDTEIQVTAPAADFTAFGAWTHSAGKDAQVKFNGFPEGAGNYYTFKGNNIRGYGLEMNLTAVGTTTITVNTDTSAIKENVEKFVEEYNKVLSKIISLSKVNANKQTLAPEYADKQSEMQKGGVLTGNYGVQLMTSLFKTEALGQARGFEYLTINPDNTFTGDIFSTLSQIGIKTDAEEGSATFGLLIYETDTSLMTLDEALDMSPEGIAQLFSANKKGYSDSSDFMVYDVNSYFTSAGKYDVEYTFDSLGNFVSGSINGRPARLDADGLLGTFDSSDKEAGGIRLMINNKAAGTHTGVARIQDGKINSLINQIDNQFLKAYTEPQQDKATGEWLHTENGIISILERQYEQIIANIETKIAKEDERIIKWERHMKLRFSRLDATLKQYENLQSQLESSIKQLPSKKE